MIGARLSPHRAHSTAIVVRVMAALVTVASLVYIPQAILDAALHHTPAATALARIAVAVALSVAAVFTVRRLDPLRG